MTTLHSTSHSSLLHGARNLLFLPNVVLMLILSCATSLGATVSFSGTSYSTPAVAGLVSADLNRDGWPDMAIAGDVGYPTVAVLLATGPGQFGPRTDYSLPADGFNDTGDVLAADFNGDEALDLIVSRRGSPQLNILWNDRAGIFHNGPTLDLSAVAASFDLGDFNHDGLLDIAAIECNFFPYPTSCYLKVYVGKGNGTFTRSQSVHLAGDASKVMVADMNGDSKPDLVMSRTTQVLLWWGRGNGTFAAPSYLTPGTDIIGSFTIADFTNDGKLDLVVERGMNLSLQGCLGGGLSLYKNMGGNNLALFWDLTGGFCANLDHIDMNGDLTEDLFLHNGHPDAGFFYGILGNGDGTLGQAITDLGVPNRDGGVGPVYVRDVNLDSRDDYIVGFEDSYETQVALQTG